MQDMDKGARGWLIKTARKNYWRVSSWYDVDDLIQDGYLHYYRLVRRYPEVTDRSHMMRLFQITYINHLHDLAKQRTRLAEVHALDTVLDTPPVEIWERLMANHYELPAVQLLGKAAPEPIRSVLGLFNSPDQVKRLRSAYRYKPGKTTRETFNEKLCRLIGINPTGVDLPRMVASYLTL